MKVRKSVKLFAEQMERVLREHDKKKGRKGWKKCLARYLRDKLDEEVSEYKGHLFFPIDDSKSQAKNELIDIANICMMLYDKKGGM